MEFKVKKTNYFATFMKFSEDKLNDDSIVDLDSNADIKKESK